MGATTVIIWNTILLSLINDLFHEYIIFLHYIIYYTTSIIPNNY